MTITRIAPALQIAGHQHVLGIFRENIALPNSVDVQLLLSSGLSTVSSLHKFSLWICGVGGAIDPFIDYSINTNIDSDFCFTQVDTPFWMKSVFTQLLGFTAFYTNSYTKIII